MSMFAASSGFVFVAAALCLGAQAHAQSAPVTYWTPGWLGFGGNLNAGQGANTNGNIASFDGSGAGAGGFSSTRTNFPNGLFVGSERNGLGVGTSGLGYSGAFGSLYGESTQFGYNFRNAPVSIFAGFDQLKYNSGIGGAFSSPFDSVSGTAGYGAHAGVEFKPASNLSLQFGFSYQQSGTVDTDTKMPSLSNTSQFDLVGGRR